MIIQGQHNLGLPGIKAAVEMLRLKTAASQLTIIYRFETTWAAGTCCMLQLNQATHLAGASSEQIIFTDAASGS